jgi:hypothetical protein
MSAINGDHKDAKPTKVLITRITELKKVQENIFEVQNNVGTNQWKKIPMESTKKY